MEVSITIDPNDERYFKTECLSLLKQLFSERSEPYKDKRHIVKACIECISYLVEVFEGECKKITTTNEVTYFLSLYSELTTNRKAYPYTERVIYTKMCKYLFGEFTKLHISSSGRSILTPNDVSRLYTITKLISNFSQHLYQCYLDDDNRLQLEIYDTYYEITSGSRKYISMQEHLKQIVESDALKGECTKSPYLLLDFFNRAQDCFGQVVPDCNNLIFDITNVIIDCDKLDFKDFVKLFDYNGIIQTRIVDLTEIFDKYHNDTFLNGLTLSSINVNLLRSIHKPHDMSLRSRFRPIIAINVDGRLRHFTTPAITYEAYSELVANQIPFGDIPREWKKNSKIVAYTKEQQAKHDKLLEDRAENIIQEKGLLCGRNKKKINNINLVEEKSINPSKNVGEIDFIIIDTNNSKVYVCDCKYIKTKYDFASFYLDKESFTKKGGYNEKITYKLMWVKSHINDVVKDMNLKVDVSSYSFDGFFITNTFVYYGLTSLYPIIPLKWLSNYFEKGQRLLIEGN